MDDQSAGISDLFAALQEFNRNLIVRWTGCSVTCIPFFWDGRRRFAGKEGYGQVEIGLLGREFPHKIPALQA